MGFPARILATRCSLRFALSASNSPTVDHFIEKFERGESPDGNYWLNRELAYRWLAGKSAITNRLLERVAREVAGTQLVFGLATLLRKKRLSAADARGVVAPLWTRADSGRSWILPCLDAHDAAGGALTSYAWEDSTALVQRSDFHGFLAILTLLRESVASNNASAWKYARDLYAILPSVCGISWLREDTDLLLQSIEDMGRGIRWAPVRFMEIDWSAFREEIVAPRPWVGVTPWIVDRASKMASENGLSQRPVPLLDGIVPLQSYVRSPAPQKLCGPIVRRSNEGERPLRELRLLLGKLEISHPRPSPSPRVQR